MTGHSPSVGKSVTRRPSGLRSPSSSLASNLRKVYHLIPFLAFYSFQRHCCFWSNGGWPYSEPQRQLVAASPTDPSTSLSGISLTPHDPSADPLFTMVHCVGENYSPNAWKYRSCQFRNLCLVNNAEVVAVESPEEQALRRILDQRTPSARHSVTVSTLLDPHRSSVSHGVSSTDPWFPRVVAHADRFSSSDKNSTYAMLPDSVVLVPISISAVPPSRGASVLWNDIYPIYTLLSLFELERKQIVLVIRGSQAGRVEMDLLVRLAPILNAMGRDRITLTLLSPSSSSISVTDGDEDWICAKYAVAGLGLRRYDEDRPAEEILPTSFTWYPQSAVEGIDLWAFRSFMMKSMQLVPSNLVTQSSESRVLPLRVAVQGSLWSKVSAIQSWLRADEVVARPLESPDDFSANAKLLSESRVLIASLDLSGDFDFGMATFLPRNSFVILLVDNVDSYDPTAPYGMSRRDWETLHLAAFFDVRLLQLDVALDSSGDSLLLRSLESVLELTHS